MIEYLLTLGLLVQDGISSCSQRKLYGKLVLTTYRGVKAFIFYQFILLAIKLELLRTRRIRLFN